MSTFFMFGRYSSGAIKEISAERTVKTAAVIGGLGGKLKAGYALLGETDLVLIVDFPGVNEAMKASVEGMKAFKESIKSDLKSVQNGGAGSTPSEDVHAGAKTMKRSAFDNLSDSQKSSFIEDGGSPID